MIVVTSRIRITSGDADAMAAAYRDRLGLADAAPGCLGVEILRHCERRDEFMVYTRWSSVADYERYRADPAFRAAHARVKNTPGTVKVARVEEGVDRFERIA